jgi:hypothetical protein
MQSGYTRFRGRPGVGLYVNNVWRLVEISCSIEYACCVKSDVCLNVITEGGNPWLYCSGKPGIGKPCLRK